MKHYKLKRKYSGELQRSQLVLPAHNRPVFYKIQAMDMVQTEFGPMELVALRQAVDLAVPGTDVAATIGTVISIEEVTRAWERPSPTLGKPLTIVSGPPLWYWHDKFWLQALSIDGIPFYRRKQHLFYEVTLRDAAKYLNELDC